MPYALFLILFALLAVAFFAPILWSRRNEWLRNHHAHLIPPVPRSYRTAGSPLRPTALGGR